MTIEGLEMTVGGIPANLVPDFSELDFDDESTLVPEVQFANGFFLFLIVIFLVIRLWTRLVIVQSSLRVDDCKLTVSLFYWDYPFRLYQEITKLFI